MSLLHKKHLLQPFKGAIGRTVVVKQYADKTVISAYPDMSKVVSSPKQIAGKSIFAEAVTYAQGINNDHLQKSA